MHIDGRTISSNTDIDADLCIIGGGPAGLSIANTLKDSGLKIVILESGDREYDDAIQALAKGESVGRPYFELDATRLRILGGNSNHWGGRCLPLIAQDFETRDWVPYSGWPINRADLAPFYQRAHDEMGLGSMDYDPRRRAAALQEELLPFDPNVVETVWTRSRSLNFAEAYHDLLSNEDNILCYLRTHVLQIETDPGGTNVEYVNVGVVGGNTFRVRPRKVVLAAGGLENPRLLMLSNSNSAHANGIGNQNDLVGRFFMEHLLYESGFFSILDRTKPYRLYDDFIEDDGVDMQATLALNPSINKEHGIAAVYFELQGRSSYSLMPSIGAARTMFSSLEHLHWPRDFLGHASNMITGIDTLIDASSKILTGAPLLHAEDPKAFKAYYYSEQVPNPDSRVRLGQEVDAFGQPRMLLDWQLTDLDIKSARVGQELFAREIGRSGVGRAVFDWSLDQDPPMPDVMGGHHHMGTTRMHDDPRWGVVDRNCQVHGVSNLYVAGSSVFPTGGYANPTLTIVALAIRLADHLRS